MHPLYPAKVSKGGTWHFSVAVTNILTVLLLHREREGVNCCCEQSGKLAAVLRHSHPRERTTLAKPRGQAWPSNVACGKQFYGPRTALPLSAFCWRVGKGLRQRRGGAGAPDQALKPFLAAEKER